MIWPNDESETIAQLSRSRVYYSLFARSISFYDRYWRRTYVSALEITIELHIVLLYDFSSNEIDSDQHCFHAIAVVCVTVVFATVS